MENLNQEKIFIGVSWPYASGKLHLGHLAGQNIACDIFARYHRQKGNRVLMVSGSDSHGTPIVFKSRGVRITPEQLVETSHKRILETFEKLSLLYENIPLLQQKTTKRLFKISSCSKELGYLYLKNQNSTLIKS